MGVWPRGAQVRQRCGRWLSPLSSINTRMRPSFSAFFLALATPSSASGEPALHCAPGLAPPVAADSSPDPRESSRHGLRDSAPEIPVRSNRPPGNRSTVESHSLSARDLRPVVSLAAAAASHSNAAFGQRVPLSAARTCRECDSGAPNEPPSAGPREVVGQSRLDAAHAPTSEPLESVVSLRLQNHEVLQQGFPYPTRRRIPENRQLYSAGFNRSSFIRKSCTC